MHPLITLIDTQRREIHGTARRPSAARSPRGRSEARVVRARVTGLRYAAPVAALSSAAVLARVLG